MPPRRSLLALPATALRTGVGNAVHISSGAHLQELGAQCLGYQGQVCLHTCPNQGMRAEACMHSSCSPCEACQHLPNMAGRKSAPCHTHLLGGAQRLVGRAAAGHLGFDLTYKAVLEPARLILRILAA